MSDIAARELVHNADQIRLRLELIGDKATDLARLLAQLKRGGVIDKLAEKLRDPNGLAAYASDQLLQDLAGAHARLMGLGDVLHLIAFTESSFGDPTTN